MPCPSVRFRLADDAALHCVGDRVTLFSGREQKLFGLNDAAAFVAGLLENGATHAELLGELVRNGCGVATGKATIATLLPAWSAAGVAVAEMPVTSETDWLPSVISIGGLDIALLLQGQGISEAITPFIRHLRSDAAKCHRQYRIARADPFVLISADGPAMSIVMPDQVVPALKALLVEDVLEAASPAIALHAACLTRNDDALMLFGSPGAGKSTLALALLPAGFGYGADDITLVNPKGRVQGVPFAPAVKAGAWKLLGLPRESGLHRRVDGRRVRYMPVHEVPRRDWIPARWLIRLRRQKGVVARLVARTPVEALADVMAEAYAPSQRASAADLAMFVDFVERAQCHELHYSDLDAAVELLRRLAADG